MDLSDDPGPVLALVERARVVEHEEGVRGEAHDAREGRVAAAGQVQQPLQRARGPVQPPEGRAVGAQAAVQWREI